MKWLLGLLLFAGCSNPCEEFLDEEEQEFAELAIRITIAGGVPIWFLREDIKDNPFFNEECGNYLIDAAIE